MKVLLRITEQPRRLIACFTQAQILSESDIQQLGHELMQAAKQAKQSGKLVLDFRQVTLMSSAMIGKLVLLNKFLKVNGILFHIWNIQPPVMEVFERTRLNRDFHITDDNEDHTSSRFIAELVEVRNQVIAALEDADFYWWRDYSTVGPLPDVYGIEVCGIPKLQDAEAIQKLLCQLFPSWTPGRLTCRNSGREPGWRASVQRDPDPQSENWETGNEQT